MFYYWAEIVGVCVLVVGSIITAICVHTWCNKRKSKLSVMNKTQFVELKQEMTKEDQQLQQEIGNDILNNNRDASDDIVGLTKHTDENTNVNA